MVKRLKRVLDGKPSEDSPSHSDVVSANQGSGAVRPPGAGPILSTGSLLLDLAITGGRNPYGGLPLGVMAEIFGEPGSGKTAILAEVCASAQELGGDILFLDPEARLDSEYSRIYGVNITDTNYYQPDTVEEVFELIRRWEPDPEVEGAPCVIACDSLAALSTEMEMESGDKYGARRAKMFSEGLRVTCRLLKQRGWLLLCSNQLREKVSEGGFSGFGPKKDSPGGQAIRFYSSLRMRITSTQKLKRKGKLSTGVSVEKVVGIKSEIEVVKSSVDDPHRTASVFILFGYGVDDLRANLQFIKELTRDSMYVVPLPEGEKRFQGIEQAISAAEAGGDSVIETIRDRVVSLWRETEAVVKGFIENRRRRHGGSENVGDK